MNRNLFKRQSIEDKFGRKFSCRLNNHKSGLSKMKRENRRLARKKLKKMLDNEDDV